MEKKLGSFFLLMFVLLLGLGLTSAISLRMGNARMILYEEVNGEDFTEIERSIYIENVNDIPVTVTLVASDEALEFIEVLDGENLLEPGEDHRAQFLIKVKDEGRYEGKIFVTFSPADQSGSSASSSSNVIVYADDPSTQEEDDEEDLDDDSDDDDNNSDDDSDDDDNSDNDDDSRQSSSSNNQNNVNSKEEDGSVMTGSVINKDVQVGKTGNAFSGKFLIFEGFVMLLLVGLLGLTLLASHKKNIKRNGNNKKTAKKKGKKK